VIAVLLATLWTNTAHVERIAAAGATLWVATAGGVEEYALPAGTRTALYTTEQGLDSNAAHRVWVEDGLVRVRTERSVCLLRQGRFACSAAEGPLQPVVAVAGRFNGARETARLKVGEQTVVATAGAGLWLDGRRITPSGQICTNHVEALAEFQGRLWVGGFDAGLCILEDTRFRTIPTPFRMINDLLATPRGLYVAAGEGLFVTTDGRTFRREARVRERGANRLAISGGRLFVTTPAALYEIRLEGRDLVRRWRNPAGSTALQAVAVSGRDVWLASEDRGVIRFRAGRFESFDRASGLPSSWFVDVASAAGGGVWAATLRNGAVRLDSNGRVRELGANPHAWGLRLYNDGGKMLFGTQQGLGGDAALPDPRVHALLRTARGLWVGTEGGLALISDAPRGAPLTGL
jgi:ligand-binding sensor domain-containing protein